MAVDLTLIDPSEFIEYRDQWLKDSGLESVGADRLFENCGLSQLTELNSDELEEYANKIGLTDIEKERLKKGINELNGITQPGALQTPLTPKTPRTPKSPKSPKTPKSPRLPTPSNSSKSGLNTPKSKLSRPSTPGKKKKSKLGKSGSKSKLSPKKDKFSRKRSKSNARAKKSPSPFSRQRSSSSSAAPMYDPTNKSSAPMYDPTNKTTPKANEGSKFENDFVREVTVQKVVVAKDMVTQINEAIEKLNSDANATRDDIRNTFMEFRQKLVEREMRLLHDVDATVDKKTRLLQTQLEYVKDNPGATELACEYHMRLLIEKPEILRTIMTAGWVLGAASGNLLFVICFCIFVYLSSHRSYKNIAQMTNELCTNCNTLDIVL